MEKLLLMQEVCDILRIKKGTLSGLFKDKKIRYITVGRMKRVSEEELNRYIRDNQTKGYYKPKEENGQEVE